MKFRAAIYIGDEAARGRRPARRRDGFESRAVAWDWVIAEIPKFGIVWDDGAGGFTSAPAVRAVVEELIGLRVAAHRAVGRMRQTARRRRVAFRVWAWNVWGLRVWKARRRIAGLVRGVG